MKVSKKLSSLLLAGTLGITVLTGCSNNSSNGEKKNGSKEVQTIGITQLVEHPSLDKAREGFIKALEDNGYKDGNNIKIDYQNAQNAIPTTQTIASKFVSDKKDLIYAISTPSAQAAYNATKDIPIMITAVTDPVEAGLVKSLEEPGGNVSGTSDYISIDKNLELVKKFAPKAKTIGVLYNTSEVNSKIQVDNLKKYAARNNYTVVEKGVSASNEVNQAMSSLVGKIDVLYVPTDNLIVSSMPIVSKIANSNKIPVLASEEGSVSSGALACQGIDYEKLGYKSGELAVKVLKGEDISNISIATLNETQIIVNEETLKALSLNKPKDDNFVYIKTQNE
ncbi:ABC transporter substrate-binding protein [Clostridioides mangenotii]|uniref:ABC transporter substrate-binding protein n=1 Tax=Metaclostridioides mangenotii TaxID=1540 RepID=UPI001C107727|nr:ABC transporter substrate-binding protein [Clostridioides mangenotii]MBU5306930.1 ABC transporter substrate-binding protein [Clostridioides mangenotii]